MYKILIIILLAFFSQKCFSQSFHDLVVKDISGHNLNLSGMRGKTVLIVNSATSGPNAGQNAKLKELGKRYKDSGLVIIIFPSNDFNNEQKSKQELKAFYKEANIIVGDKTTVKGNAISPLFKWLTQKQFNGVTDIPVTGDFQKFIINKNGKLVGFFSGKADPSSAYFIKALTIN